MSRLARLEPALQDQQQVRSNRQVRAVLRERLRTALLRRASPTPQAVEPPQPAPRCLTVLPTAAGESRAATQRTCNYYAIKPQWCLIAAAFAT
ncbi:hypothetical protein IscW_ISCW009447 [Ixodes scapularis]|uniref:Uncharacterized protein n=1 Tax=Ixodes scapularis TaxID=6945 RepID=B7PZ60_IXOSC|nr:hypothetical protein IscW_ISCW009447 [Ixodes scapularis]|eukprot:XP_002404823.1 hypothetical protein IscW_ISCW009447 [Ixodes scapularis]